MVVDARDDAGWFVAERMARRVLALYEQQVGSVRDLAAELQLDSVPDPELEGRHEPPSAALQRLYASAVRRLSYHASAIEGRPMLRPADWRVVLYGLDGGRTLREAILRASDCFEAIDGRCGLMTLRVRGEIAELRFDTRRQRRDATNCLIDLNGIPQMYSQLCWLVDKPIPVIEFALDYPREIYDELMLPPLPFPLRFAQGWSGFSFRAAYLDFPLIRGSADRGGASEPASLLFLGGADPWPQPPAAQRVRALALQALREEQRLPPFEEIVRSFGCSAATLRRQLGREGGSYREIRNSCRREVGIDLLRRTALTIEEIAVRLDFCDSDAFRTAFHDWTGESPSSYRRLAQGGASRAIMPRREARVGPVDIGKAGAEAR